MIGSRLVASLLPNVAEPNHLQHGEGSLVVFVNFVILNLDRRLSIVFGFLFRYYRKVALHFARTGEMANQQVNASRIGGEMWQKSVLQPP